MHHHARVTVGEPTVQRGQLTVSSVHWAGGWRLIGVRGVNTHKRRQSARLWKAVRFGCFPNAAKSNISVGQDTLVLGMEENLEQTQLGLEQSGCFRGFDFEKFSVHVSHQDFGLLQSDVPLICLKSTFFGELPCFLSPLVALNGSGVLLNEQGFE